MSNKYSYLRSLPFETQYAIAKELLKKTQHEKQYEKKGKIIKLKPSYGRVANV